MVIKTEAMVVVVVVVVVEVKNRMGHFVIISIIISILSAFYQVNLIR